MAQEQPGSALKKNSRRHVESAKSEEPERTAHLEEEVVWKQPSLDQAQGSRGIQGAIRKDNVLSPSLVTSCSDLGLLLEDLPSSDDDAAIRELIASLLDDVPTYEGGDLPR